MKDRTLKPIHWLMIASIALGLVMFVLFQQQNTAMPKLEQQIDQPPNQSETTTTNPSHDLLRTLRPRNP